MNVPIEQNANKFIDINNNDLKSQNRVQLDANRNGIAVDKNGVNNVLKTNEAGSTFQSGSYLNKKVNFSLSHQNSQNSLESFSPTSNFIG